MNNNTFSIHRLVTIGRKNVVTTNGGRVISADELERLLQEVDEEEHSKKEKVPTAHAL